MSMGAKIECQHSSEGMIMDDDVILFNDISKTLSTITSNLSLISKCAAENPQLEDLEKEIKQLDNETQAIKNGVLEIIEVCLPKVDSGIHHIQSELKSTEISMTQAIRTSKKYSAETQALREEAKVLKSQFSSQENLISSLKKDIIRKNEQLKILQDQLAQERNMCTSIGSTLACMLWRACRESEVVTSMLSWYKFPEFLKIATGTLESFNNTYIIDSNEMAIPIAGSEEGHFVAGMIGTVTNMSASPSGREILLGSESGQQLLACIVETLAFIPSPRGDYLRRLLLMTVYNIIIEEAGLEFLLKLGGLPLALGKKIMGQEEECLTLSLHILALYSSSVPLQTLKQAFKQIPVEDLKKITIAEQGQNCMLAKEILQNLQNVA
ncbi:uncharacterized protein LOC124157329 [Ischnura elegans]|uniref:uncharacterized protein LOC124157329 n=1 Tax=Ischnura elegans TaxID=197161 RepID=UPI001ED8BCEB|nr:uncharacterized protein LOC124157329 [Ischnura elegans]